MNSAAEHSMMLDAEVRVPLGTIQLMRFHHARTQVLCCVSCVEKRRQWLDYELDRADRRLEADFRFSCSSSFWLAFHAASDVSPREVRERLAPTP